MGRLPLTLQLNTKSLRVLDLPELVRSLLSCEKFFLGRCGVIRREFAIKMLTNSEKSEIVNITAMVRV